MKQGSGKIFSLKSILDTGSAVSNYKVLDRLVYKIEYVSDLTDVCPAEPYIENNCHWKRNNMASLFWTYKDDDGKYSKATTDSHERMFILLLGQCEQVDFLGSHRNRAFQITLTGHVSQLYVNVSTLKNLSLMELEAAVKSQILAPERTRTLLWEWGALSTTTTTSTNTDKSPSRCQEQVIIKVSDIQTSLPLEYRNETILKIKLLNAVKDVRAYQQVYHKPAKTAQGVISDLHASLATVKSFVATEASVEP